MRVKVEETSCQGHTQCAMNAPDIFQLRDEDGHAYVTDELVPAGHEAEVRTAAAACPERAVVLWDDSEG